jgi:hypothetical protein
MTDTPLTPEFVEPVPLHERPLYQDWHDAEPEPAPERDEEAVMATPTAAPPRPETPPQEPMAAGTYAVYDDQQGGYVLVLGTREGQTHHKHIPAKVVKMGEMMMGGNSPLAALFGG